MGGKEQVVTSSRLQPRPFWVSRCGDNQPTQNLLATRPVYLTNPYCFKKGLPQKEREILSPRATQWLRRKHLGTWKPLAAAGDLHLWSEDCQWKSPARRLLQHSNLQHTGQWATGHWWILLSREVHPKPYPRKFSSSSWAIGSQWSAKSGSPTRAEHSQLQKKDQFRGRPFKDWAKSQTKQKSLLWLRGHSTYIHCTHRSNHIAQDF